MWWPDVDSNHGHPGGLVTARLLCQLSYPAFCRGAGGRSLPEILSPAAARLLAADSDIITTWFRGDSSPQAPSRVGLYLFLQHCHPVRSVCISRYVVVAVDPAMYVGVAH